MATKPHEAPIKKRGGPPMGHPPYNVNGEGGAPVKYDDAFMESVAVELEKWNESRENLFIEDFLVERKLQYSRFNEWVKLSHRLSEAYNNLKLRQKTALIKGSLTRKFAHPMCALVLSHAHGMHAKVETQFSGDTTNPLAFLIQHADGNSKDLIKDE